MNLRPKSRVSTEFNMSSMTDIVFLLLIFFILVSTIVKEPALRLVLPQGVMHQQIEEPIRVYVDKDLNYAVGAQLTTKERLPFTLAAELRKKPGATVSIHGDKSIKYENVMDIVMIADKLKAKVVLALDSKK